MPSELDEAKVLVRSSKVREEIVRELYDQSDLRPTEILDRIQVRVDTTKENFYQNLKALTGDILHKVEGSRRMTLYSLTDLGKQVAEELKLTKSEKDKLRSFAFETSLSNEEIETILTDIRERGDEQE